MRRLVAIFVAVTGGVIAACGDGGSSLESDRAVTSTSVPGSPTTALADNPAPVGAAETLEIEWTGETRVPAGPHTWTIDVTNTSDATVVVTFPTAQRGDAVLTRDGEAVHRWSDARFFQQQVTEISLEPGGIETVELSDDLSSVEPGFYDVTVSVAVVGPPEPDTRSIRVITPGE